jgi:hypothetical protein
MNNLTYLVFLGMVAVAVCQMAGAPSDAAIDDPVVVKMATFAASEIGSEFELVNVLSATKQVRGSFFCLLFFYIYLVIFLYLLALYLISPDKIMIIYVYFYLCTNII